MCSSILEVVVLVVVLVWLERGCSGNGVVRVLVTAGSGTTEDGVRVKASTTFFLGSRDDDKDDDVGDVFVSSSTKHCCRCRR